MKHNEQFTKTRGLPGDIVFSIIFIFFALGFILWSYQYESSVRMVPILIGYMMLGVSVADFLVRYRLFLKEHTGRDDLTSDNEDKSPSVFSSFSSEIKAIVWMGGLFAGIYFLGFQIMTPAYIFFSIHLRGKISIKRSAMIAVGCTGLIWFVFSYLLNHEFYGGVLFS